MDFFNIRSMHANDFRMDPTLAPILNRTGGSHDFAALFERARNTSADNADSAATGAARTPGIPNGVRDEKLFQLCLDLETFLVKNLLNSMRSTIQRSGLIEQSFAGKIYEDMLFDEHARNFTRNAGFGLAKQAYLQLTGRR